MHADFILCNVIDKDTLKHNITHILDDHVALFCWVSNTNENTQSRVDFTQLLTQHRYLLTEDVAGLVDIW